MILDVSKEAYDAMSSVGGTYDPMPEALRKEVGAAITAYTHEHVHTLQMALCGFPFRWASELFDIIRPAVAKLRNGQRGDDIGHLLNAIKLGEAALSPDEVEALGVHFAKLDEPCSIGLTTRSILESHAHVIQRRANYEINDFSELAPHVADAPGAEYRAAFDVLAFAINPKVAYAWFPLICSVALCTERPAVSFNRLTLALAANPTFLPQDPTRDNALQVQRDLADIVNSELIGSASQVAAARKEGTPLRRLVQAAEEIFSNQAFDPSWAYAALHEELLQLVQHLPVPVFLRPVAPQGFAIKVPPDMDKDVALAHLSTAALSSQLTRALDARSRARGADALDRLDWLRGHREPLLVRLSSQHLSDTDHTPLLNLSDPATNQSLSGRELARLWGRIVLLAPDEIDPEGEAILSNLTPVRAYLSALSRRFPAFPVVLSWTQGMSGFVDWFGSMAPEAMNGDGLMLDYPELFEAVMETTKAIEELGEEVDQNPSLAIQLMRLPLLRIAV